jgi:hypothetical protein
VNPPDRSADLKIRRVRFVASRERWNARKHRKGNAAGREWEAMVRKEFRAAREGDAGDE